jgi:hypothetical protein
MRPENRVTQQKEVKKNEENKQSRKGAMDS